MYEVNMKVGIQLSYFNFFIVKSYICCVYYKLVYVGDGCIYFDYYNSGVYSFS